MPGHLGPLGPEKRINSLSQLDNKVLGLVVDRDWWWIAPLFAVPLLCWAGGPRWVGSLGSDHEDLPPIWYFCRMLCRYSRMMGACWQKVSSPCEVERGKECVGEAL